MSFISPMLAASMPKTAPRIDPGMMVAEEKLDGHRLVVHVANVASLPATVKEVTAWSRNGLIRPLPTHLAVALGKLQPGIYDGELLVPGKRSYGVTEIVNGPDLVYTVFDILQLMGTPTINEPYARRRAYLELMGEHGLFDGAVTLSKVYPVISFDHAMRICEEIWERDGEGIILKRLSARYVPGKRPKDAWVKIKALRSAVLTVIGFIPSKGEINDRGPYATVALRDDDGNETTVKTRNDEELARFAKQATKFSTPFTLSALPRSMAHPAIGRKLRIEYQERTPDGNYRHPRWDRWEDE